MGRRRTAEERGQREDITKALFENVKLLVAHEKQKKERECRREEREERNQGKCRRKIGR